MDEALLTGESLPIPKFADVTLHEADVSIGDRTNMAYSASLVSRGRGTGIVVATAMDTEVGKIAGLLQQPNAKFEESSFKGYMVRFRLAARHALGFIGTPLQVTLSKFALWLFALAILLAVIVFSASKWDIDDEVLIYGICVAVAVIPESLIAVLTLTTAVGTKAMAKSNIIIRKLSSLEAVGSVDAICSDKTGTLTQGKMIVRHAAIEGGLKFDLAGTTNPYDPHSGAVSIDGKTTTILDLDSDHVSRRYLDIVALCNLAQVQCLPQNGGISLTREASGRTPSMALGQGEWAAVGEPTEIALQVFAMRFNHGRTEAIAKANRSLIAEFPFDSTIKRMTMVYSRGTSGAIDLFTKGATEAVLPILNCSEAGKEMINAEAERLAGEGLRVLCLAHKEVLADDASQYTERSIAESKLTFAGYAAIYDPPRAETAGAVATCKKAGITVHMLTGDHIRTASAIAAEVGIIDQDASNAPLRQNGNLVMAAADFDKLSEEQIDRLDTLPLVLARCSPATKVRMVEALHRRKAFCIMTGDGINDSPALKLADIGIAMGLNGSDVAKQAADMVLADDNFASIVLAIKEGRRLFDNIQKFLVHLLTSNVAQIVLLMIGLAFKDTDNYSIFPLSPLEILWANLVTSSPIALGLGLEPAAPDVMTRPPRSRKIGILSKEVIWDNLVYGVTKGACCLATFAIVTYNSNNVISGSECNHEYSEACNTVFRARATTFAMFTFGLIAIAWEVMDFKASLFNMPAPPGTTRTTTGKVFSIFPTLYSNKFLFWSCVFGILTLFPLIYIPLINTEVFKHAAITWEWGIVVGFAVLDIGVMEAWKMGKRKGWLNWLLYKDENDGGAGGRKELVESSSSSIV